MAQPKLMLVDGHAVAFRAFHALRDANLRSTATGEPTYAVFGFLQIVLTQLQKMMPEYAAVSFDMGRTFRHDDFADYKAGRGEAPDEFHAQLARIKEVVTALNIPIYVAPNFEADDVIGTLATQASGHGVDTYILTGDTDTLQLVDDHVRVLLSVPYRQAQEIKEYDVEVVGERYGGLRPAQLTDLRGLKGDASDNIPGVKGIGEQGAITLLNQFGTVEAIFDHLDEVGKRYQKVLTGQRDIAMLSKQLATIRCDVPVELDLEHSRLRDYDRDTVIALFRELEFGRLIAKLPEVGAVPPAAEPPVAADSGYTLKQAKPKVAKATAQTDMFDIDAVFGAPATAAAGTSTAPSLPVLGHNSIPAGGYQAVTTGDQLAALVAALQAAPQIAFDTETNGLNELRSELVGLSFATTAGSGWYVPVAHQEVGGEQLEAGVVRAALQPVLEDGTRPKVAHNAKFDLLVLRRWGIDVHGVIFDSMIAAQLLGKRGGLKDLALYELDVEMTEITDLIGSGKTQTTFAYVPLDRAAAYAGADADMTLRLYERLAAQLAEFPRIRHIFEMIEMPLIPVLADMQWTGIKVDVTVLHNLSTQMYHRLQEIEHELMALAGQPFNPSSSQQVSDILFGKLQLPTAGLSKVKSGHYSITADVLDKLRGEHQIIDLILEYRQLSKLKSTYLDAIPQLADEHGRVHTSYNQLGASTGRLSSQDPNLQNIPIRTEQGRGIRRAFISEHGHHLLAADYSQIELRILAHATQDPALVDIFKQGQDIHAATAARLFDVPLDQITKNQRRIAKMTVFGTIYGISSFGLSARTELSRSEAQQLISGLFETYPGLRRFFDEILEQGRSQGFVETLLGRRRYMPELTSTNGARRQAAEREAINAPIQGTSADLIKMAMVRLHDELQRRALGTKMLLQVHDELVLEVPDGELAEVGELIRRTMTEVYPELSVPLDVHLATGTNWESMEE